MRDPQLAQTPAEKESSRSKNIIKATRLTLQAGRWIVHTPFALAVILLGMCFDHVLRMLVTMTSQYFRLISLPEASFGLIGSGIALMGLVVPRIARAMVHRFSPGQNACVVGVVAFSSLWGLTLFVPYYGILPVVLLFIGMMLTSFFTSHYLNEITDSVHRATVLSFKGLAFNAAYGLIGLFYAGLIQVLRATSEEKYPDWSSPAVKNAAFEDSIHWFPWYLFLVLVVVVVVLFLMRGVSGAKKQPIEGTG